MITKENYHKLKKHIRTLSRPQVKQLCLEMELDDMETKLLLSSYDKDLVVKICMDNFICESAYKKYIKLIYSKVYNYFQYTNTSF